MASSSSHSSPPQSRSVFASPWNDSDIVLVVENKEIHAHRSILCLQSPVFKAMLCGQFSEAKAEFIPLPEKKYKAMLQFIQLLYPPNMIKAAKVLINDENIFDILKLADEYQAVHVVGQCLNGIQITKSNAVPLLVYANQYDKSLLPKFLEVTSRHVSAAKLQECAAVGIGDEKLTQRLLLSKCNYLESLLIEGNRFGQKLLRRACPQRRVNGDVCGHVVSVTNFHKARSCPSCLETYRTDFLTYAVTSSGELVLKVQEELEGRYLNYLEQVDDIVMSLCPAGNTVKEGEIASTP